MAEEKEKGRSWGQAAEDVVGNVLSAIANGGKLTSAAAAALEAGLNTDSFQRRQKMADMALQQAEADTESKKLQNQLTQQTLEHNKNQEQRAEAQEKRNAAQEARNVAQHAINIENSELNQKVQGAKLAALQRDAQKAFEEEASIKIAQDKKRFIDDFRKTTGHNDLNYFGQWILDIDPAVETAAELFAVTSAYDRGDKEGDFAAAQTGWTVSVDENGVRTLTDPNTKQSVVLNDQTIPEIMKMAAANLKQAQMAAFAVGSPATSLEQYTIGQYVGDKDAVALFGGASDLLSQYQKHVSSFGKEEQLIHLMARTLKGAVVDGKITDEEMASLAPLFGAAAGKFRLGVVSAENINDTKIKLRDGSLVPIGKFTERLLQEDVIGNQWDDAINGMKQKAISSVAEVNNEHKLYGTYGNSYLDLTDTQRADLSKLAKEQEVLANAAVKKEGVSNISELSTGTLNALDAAWNRDVGKAGMDPEAIYSPYNDLLLQRELEDLTGQIDKDTEKHKRLPDKTDKVPTRYLIPGFSPYEPSTLSGIPYGWDENPQKKDMQRSIDKKNQRIAEIKKILEQRGVI